MLIDVSDHIALDTANASVLTLGPRGCQLLAECVLGAHHTAVCVKVCILHLLRGVLMNLLIRLHPNKLLGPHHEGPLLTGVLDFSNQGQRH